MGPRTIPDAALAGDSRAARALGALAVAVALAAATAMGVRPQNSPDLGYHLAYGEEFLDTFRPVDTNPYVYMNPSPQEADRPPPGPGCWYDREGRYHFANANWLSQVAMAAAWRMGGFGGLSALQAALAAAIFVVMTAAARRLGAGWSAVALGVLLAAMASYPRMNLRPEMFGYLVLAGQLAVLAGRRARLGEPGGGIGWRGVAAMISLQWLFVNLHSYFLLGLLPTAAMLGESALRLLWARRAARRLGTPAAEDTPGDRQATRRQAARLAAAMGGQLAVCFLNPWTWRGAILPIQTILFLRAGEVTTSPYIRTRHPWAVIQEFASVLGPWSPAETKATVAFYLLVGLACLAAVACLLRRRWGHLAILAGMTAASLVMRRNMAAGAVVLTPLALGALASWPGRWMRWAWPAAMRRFRLAASAAAVLLAGGTMGLVVSQRFYTDEELPWRFGWGASRLLLPLDASDFLTRNRPAGRLWTDYNTCSNFYYFVRPHPPVPALTNTWAYPPAVMSELMDYLMGGRPFEEARRRYLIQTVAVFAPGFPSLVRSLRDDPNWCLAYLDPMCVVYLRADGPNADLARRLAISPRDFDANGLLRQAREWDPAPYYAMHMAGSTLYHVGWDDQAIQVFRAALGQNGLNHRSWNMVGVCHARRGQGRLVEMIRLQEARRYAQADQALAAGRQDWQEARRCFLRARELQPDSSVAAVGLENIRQQLEALGRGVVIQMQYPL